MRASRLLHILMLLQTRGGLSAPALAAATEVSLRTIYRDVDHLSAAGVPVWAEPGRNGGIRLREGWRTELTGLTAAEARAVFMTGLPGPAAELGLGEAMSAAQLKLMAALPADARADAGRIAARFYLDPIDWFRSTEPPRFLAAVAAAVWNGERLRLRYESWQRVSERVVEPLGLVLKAGTWYLAAKAAGRAEPSVFRLAAIEAMTLLGERFDPPPRFDLPAWWRASAARFEAGVYTATARLRVDEEGFKRLAHFTAQVAAAAADSAEPSMLAEGWIELTIPIESVEHAANALLRLGEHAEVLAPAALRERLLATATRLTAIYAQR